MLRAFRGMERCVRLWLIVMVALAAPLAGVSSAQAVARSFEELAARVNPAGEIWVTHASGDEHRAVVVDLSPSMLSISTKNGPMNLGPADVLKIRQRHKDPKWNGAIIGAVVALAYPVWFCSVSYESGETCGENVEDLVLTGVLGAAIGAWIDSGIKGKKVVYERKVGSATLRLAPMISPRSAGVQVALRLNPRDR